MNTTTQTISNAVDSAYDSAGKALHDLQGNAQHIQDTLSPIVSEFTTKAHKFMHDSIVLASDTKDSAERAFHDAKDATSKYIANQPIKSICIAAGVGAGVALLVYALRSHSDKS